MTLPINEKSSPMSTIKSQVSIIQFSSNARQNPYTDKPSDNKDDNLDDNLSVLEGWNKRKRPGNNNNISISYDSRLSSPEMITKHQYNSHKNILANLSDNLTKPFQKISSSINIKSSTNTNNTNTHNINSKKDQQHYQSQFQHSQQPSQQQQYRQLSSEKLPNSIKLHETNTSYYKRYLDLSNEKFIIPTNSILTTSKSNKNNSNSHIIECIPSMRATIATITTNQFSITIDKDDHDHEQIININPNSNTHITCSASNNLNTPSTKKYNAKSISSPSTITIDSKAKVYTNHRLYTCTSDNATNSNTIFETNMTNEMPSCNKTTIKKSYTNENNHHSHHHRNHYHCHQYQIFFPSLNDENKYNGLIYNENNRSIDRLIPNEVSLKFALASDQMQKFDNIVSGLRGYKKESKNNIYYKRTLIYNKRAASRPNTIHKASKPKHSLDQSTEKIIQSSITNTMSQRGTSAKHSTAEDITLSSNQGITSTYHALNKSKSSMNNDPRTQSLSSQFYSKKSKNLEIESQTGNLLERKALSTRVLNQNNNNPSLAFTNEKGILSTGLIQDNSILILNEKGDDNNDDSGDNELQTLNNDGKKKIEIMKKSFEINKGIITIDKLSMLNSMHKENEIAILHKLHSQSRVDKNKRRKLVSAEYFMTENSPACKNKARVLKTIEGPIDDSCIDPKPMNMIESTTKSLKDLCLNKIPKTPLKIKRIESSIIKKTPKSIGYPESTTHERKSYRNNSYIFHHHHHHQMNDFQKVVSNRNNSETKKLIINMKSLENFPIKLGRNLTETGLDTDNNLLKTDRAYIVNGIPKISEFSINNMKMKQLRIR